MRNTTAVTVIFVFVNALVFSWFLWFNKSAASVAKSDRDYRRQFLRDSHSFEAPIVADELYANTQRFSVVIVTHNEALLEKTYPILLDPVVPSQYCIECAWEYSNRTTEGSAYRGRQERASDHVESGSRTSSYRPFRLVEWSSYNKDERLGLIRARILGGNSAAGDLIAFLDAHCRVSPHWLDSPYRLIMEVGTK